MPLLRTLVFSALAGVVAAGASALLGLGGAPSAVLGTLTAMALGYLLSWSEVRRLRALEKWLREIRQGRAPGAETEGELAKIALAAQRAIGDASEQERARADEAEVLSAALDGMTEGMWITDGEGRVVRHNAALIALLGVAGPAVGKRPLELIRDPHLHEAVLSACRANEPTALVIEHGSRILSLRIAPLAFGRPGSTATFRDVTELRRLEKVRRDFVANVSHELSTPVTAIRGYAETLKDGALAQPEHATRMVEVIHRQAERLSALLADLLSLSRIEAGQRKMKAEALPLSPLLSEVRDAFALKAAEKRLHLTAETEREAAALADRGALEQVLSNLVDNAVKYTPHGGRISLSARVEASSAVLTVEDTGPGIAPEHLSRVFERFYRVDGSRSREGGGTGLGLAIVKHLVSEMKGEVGVESEPGRGSRFTVRLPVP